MRKKRGGVFAVVTTLTTTVTLAIAPTVGAGFRSGEIRGQSFHDGEWAPGIPSPGVR